MNHISLLKTHLRYLVPVILWAFTLTGSAQYVPNLSITITDSAANEGYYFLVPYGNTPPYIYDHTQLILDPLGQVVFYRTFPSGGNHNITIDFKLQPNGQMSYFNTNLAKFFLMDSTFTVVDSIGCANGFRTDQHDLQILPGNHYLLFGTETRFMNLSSYHYFGFNHTQPGSTNAEVYGVVIQEFDTDKDLVWEWKSHDHYQFDDVGPVWLSDPLRVDWTHANAVELDNDGNILVSLRHFNEITKINRETGNIIWRLGGKRNQFTFVNDPVRFTGQHDIRRVSPNTVSIFDNGQYSVPRRSRAIEYALDETAKTATLVWEYIYDSNLYSLACGNHQRITNGNHLVDFGFANGGFPWMVVVKPDQSKVVEFEYPIGYTSYRAFNYPVLPWQLQRPEISCTKIGDNYYFEAAPGHPEYLWSTGATNAAISIADTGDYWVFVPYGAGYISSEHIRVYDISNPCLYLGDDTPLTFAACALAVVPNPATGHAKLLISLPAGSPVTISLHNLQGNEISLAFSGTLTAGSHQIPLDVSSLPRGIYLVTMVTTHTPIVKKLVVQ